MSEAKTSFKFVFIPHDLSRPVEELTQELPPGQEVECLLDRLKDHFRAAKPKSSAQSIAAKRAAFQQNLPKDVSVDDKLLDIATSLQLVETVSLLSHAKDNNYIGVNMYVDDEGSLAGMPLNMRATEIAHCCGMPIEVKGDAFLARVLDDGDNFGRLDLTLNEVSSSADWVKAAQRQQEQRRQRDTSSEGLIRQMQASSNAAKIKELTPAESAKEDGNLAFKRGDWQAAEEAYSRAVELDGTMVAALNNRAMTRLKLEKWQDAENDCTAVLEIEPNNAKALLRRATAREALGKCSEAENDLCMVLEKQANNKEAKDKLDGLRAKVS